MSDLLGHGAALAPPPSVYRDVAVLFLGWGLGILSSPITDAIRRRSAKQRLSRAAMTELRSLQDTLACVVVHVAKRHRMLTHSLLEALMTTLRSSGHVAADGRAMRMIGALLELDEQALAASKPPEHSQDPRTVLSLQVYGLPFLESHLHRLDLYTLETQRQLIEIRAGVQLFNQCADEAMHYHFMTFTSGIRKDDIDALVSNIEACYERAAEKASDLVSRVAELLQSREMRIG